MLKLIDRIHPLVILGITSWIALAVLEVLPDGLFAEVRYVSSTLSFLIMALSGLILIRLFRLQIWAYFRLPALNRIVVLLEQFKTWVSNQVSSFTRRLASFSFSAAVPHLSFGILGVDEDEAIGEDEADILTEVGGVGFRSRALTRVRRFDVRVVLK